MTSFKLENTEPTPTSSTPRRGATLEDWMKELDEYYVQMRDFGTSQPDEIFRSLSAWTARASHMRSMIHRSNSKLQQGFRTKQIEPFLVECDRQFKIWSRVFSVYSLDFKMSGGQV